MDERQIARYLALSRIAIGAALLAAPGRAGERWIGPTAHDPAAKMMIRGLGIRDLALGAGAYQALASGGQVRPWLQGAVASDAIDAAAAVIGLRRIGAMRALPTIAVAAGAAALGARLASSID
jgi:hypothetical protein